MNYYKLETLDMFQGTQAESSAMQFSGIGYFFWVVCLFFPLISSIQSKHCIKLRIFLWSTKALLKKPRHSIFRLMLGVFKKQIAQKLLLYVEFIPAQEEFI